MKGLLDDLSRKLSTAVRLLRSDRGRLRQLLHARLFRYVVFSARPADIAAAAAPEGVEIRVVGEPDLAGVDQSDGDLRDAVDRCGKLLGTFSYGAFCQGELAHISFLIPAERDRDRRPRLVKLRPGEAEIGSCVTFPRFRGRGLYPLVIRTVAREAGALGYDEVFMITEQHNVASQQGILKAGFHPRPGGLRHVRFLRRDIVFRPFRRRARGTVKPPREHGGKEQGNA